MGGAGGDGGESDPVGHGGHGRGGAVGSRVVAGAELAGGVAAPGVGVAVAAERDGEPGPGGDLGEPGPVGRVGDPDVGAALPGAPVGGHGPASPPGGQRHVAHHGRGEVVRGVAQEPPVERPPRPGRILTRPGRRAAVRHRLRPRHARTALHGRERHRMHHTRAHTHRRLYGRGVRGVGRQGARRRQPCRTRRQHHTGPAGSRQRGHTRNSGATRRGHAGRQGATGRRRQGIGRRGRRGVGRRGRDPIRTIHRDGASLAAVGRGQDPGCRPSGNRGIDRLRNGHQAGTQDRHHRHDGNHRASQTTTALEHVPHTHTR